MAIKFTNNATAELAAGIDADDLSIEVESGQGDRFPAVSDPDYFYGTLEDVSGNKEIVKVTARSIGSNVMTIVRAQDNTTGRTFAIGSKFELRLTAAVLELIRQELATHEALTGSGAHGLGTISTQNANAVDISGGAAALDNESSNRAIKARDHNQGTTPEIANVIFGTGSPPTANTVPLGTIFVKYI